MKIRRVFLVQWWFAEAGGMEQHAANLASALGRSGIEVVVFSQMPLGRGSHYGRQLREAGVKVIAPPFWLRGAALSKQTRKAVRRAFYAFLSPLILLERFSWKVRGYPGARRDMVDVVNDVVFCNYSRLLARALLDWRQRLSGADLVHVHGFRLDHVWVLRWARERGIPTVYTEHGTIADWDGLWESDAPENLLLADVITSVSDRSRQSLYDFIPKSVPVEIVPHVMGGLGGGRIRALDGGPRSPDPCLRVACFARLQAEKGTDHLVRAMQKVVDSEPRARLTLAGKGPEQERLTKLAADLGLDGNVRFRGGFAPSELGELMSEADIVVLPSLTEGLPLTLIEAMAFGKPILATRAGGIPERIRNEENGLLVEPGSSDALADGILRLAREPALRSRLGAAARADYEADGLHGAEALAAVLRLYAVAIAKHAPRAEEGTG